MRNTRMVLCFGILGAALAMGGEVMVPEATEMPGATKLLVSLVAEEGKSSFLVRSLGGEEQRSSCPVPADGLERFKLALIAQVGKDAAIQGFTLVTWKPASKKEDIPERQWPEIKEVPGATARIRGAETLMLRRFEASEGSSAKWAFELISFRKIEPKDDEDPIVRAKKEVLEEGGARLIEDRRFTLFAPSAPGEDPRYGILLNPVWKEGRLDGYDAQLVTTRAPAKEARE